MAKRAVVIAAELLESRLLEVSRVLLPGSVILGSFSVQLGLRAPSSA